MCKYGMKELKVEEINDIVKNDEIYGSIYLLQEREFVNSIKSYSKGLYQVQNIFGLKNDIYFFLLLNIF